MTLRKFYHLNYSLFVSRVLSLGMSIFKGDILGSTVLIVFVLFIVL